MNRKEISQAMAYMTGLWPNYHPPETDFEITVGEQAWYDVLGDIDQFSVRNALLAISRQGNEFPPTPGQIRQYVEAKRKQLSRPVPLVCPECNGNRWIRRGVWKPVETFKSKQARIKDPNRKPEFTDVRVDDWAVPCSRCLPDEWQKHQGDDPEAFVRGETMDEYIDRQPAENFEGPIFDRLKALAESFDHSDG